MKFKLHDTQLLEQACVTVKTAFSMLKSIKQISNVENNFLLPSDAIISFRFAFTPWLETFHSGKSKRKEDVGLAQVPLVGPGVIEHTTYVKYKYTVTVDNPVIDNNI